MTTTSAEHANSVYPLRWKDIPKGSLCEALIDGRPTLLVRWTETGVGGVAMIPSASAGPEFPLHATNTRQGPARIIAEGLSDDHCTMVARLSGERAKATALLLSRASSVATECVYMRDVPIGTVGVSWYSWCGAVFVKFVDRLTWNNSDRWFDWIGNGEVECKIMLTGLSPAQCEALVAMKYEDLPDALQRLAAELEDAKRPAPYKVGDKVRWKDLRPGSVFRVAAGGAEYLRLRTPNADGGDIVDLVSGDVSCYCSREYDLYEFTVLAADLSDVVCEALRVYAGPDTKMWERWELMSGVYVPLHTVPRGRLAMRVDGTWVAKLTNGATPDEYSEDDVTADDLVTPREMEMPDDALMSTLVSDSPYTAYCKWLGRSDGGDDAAVRRAIIAEFVDASRAFLVDVLEYPRVRAVALGAARAFVEDGDPHELRRFGVYARKTASGWWGWWGTEPRHAASPEALLLLYYQDCPTDEQVLAALLGRSDDVSCVYPENQTPLLLDSDPVVAIGKLLSSTPLARRTSTMVCSNDQLEVRVTMSHASTLPVDGPTVFVDPGNRKNILVVWDFAGDAARAKLFAMTVAIESEVVDMCPGGFELIYLDMAPKPCED